MIKFLSKTAKKFTMRPLRHVSGMCRNAISVAQTIFSQDRTLRRHYYTWKPSIIKDSKNPSAETGTETPQNTLKHSQKCTCFSTWRFIDDYTRQKKSFIFHLFDSVVLIQTDVLWHSICGEVLQFKILDSSKKLKCRKKHRLHYWKIEKYYIYNILFIQPKQPD